MVGTVSLFGKRFVQACQAALRRSCHLTQSKFPIERK